MKKHKHQCKYLKPGLVGITIVRIKLEKSQHTGESYLNLSGIINDGLQKPTILHLYSGLKHGNVLKFKMGSSESHK